ncbi:hypothetical protein BJY52DRAFT_1229272 [Lactarius psammicola]|nr:hypothetical protein BJY52DRAFT_1229272 [Lactarius psammicola]
MGAKRQRRRPRPAAAPSPEPSATERIGALNRKKPHVKIMDLYSGGLSSGRDAVPDVQSAAQNVDAHTRATAATIGVGPSSSQPPKRGHKRMGIPAPSAPPCSLPPPPSHVHIGTASAPLPPPTLAWYPIPTAYPPGMYTHAPYHTAYPSYWSYGYLPPS